MEYETLRRQNGKGQQHPVSKQGDRCFFWGGKMVFEVHFEGTFDGLFLGHFSVPFSGAFFLAFFGIFLGGYM